MADGPLNPTPPGSLGRRGARSRHRARSDDTYLDAISGLPRRHRTFVRAALQGADYESAARAAGFRNVLSVAYLLGRADVALALQRLAPLLPDQRHARKLLEPFALQALAGNLKGDAPHASRATAAREIVTPASMLDSRVPGAPPSASSAGGAGGPGSDWARRRAAAKDRREAARAGLALVPSPAGPRLDTAGEVAPHEANAAGEAGQADQGGQGTSVTPSAEGTDPGGDAGIGGA